MKKLVSFLVMVAFCAQTASAFAQAKPADATKAQTDAVVQQLKDIPKVELVYGIYRNEPAPYTGVLLSIEAAAAIIAEYQSSIDTIQLEVQKAQRDAAALCIKNIADCKSTAVRETSSLAAQLQSEREQNNSLLKQLALLDKKKKPNWKVWTVVGVGALVLAGIATTFIVIKAKKP